LFFISFSGITYGQNCDLDCENIVVNETVILTDSDPLDLHSAFNEDRAIPWKQSKGSPHFTYEHGINECWFSNYDPSTQSEDIFDCLACQISPNGASNGEGIYQDIDFIQDQTISYCINIDAHLVDCSGNLTNAVPSDIAILHLRAVNNIQPTASTLSYFGPSTVFNLDDDEIGTKTITNSINSVSIENYQPDQDYEQIELVNGTILSSSPTNTTLSILSFDNIEINCKTTSLDEGFTLVKNCLEVNFNAGNSSSFTYDTDSYLWSLGDGTTSTEVNPTHTYTEAGTYTVCLDVVNELGCCGQYCEEIIVEDCSCSTCDYQGQTYDYNVLLDGNNPDLDQLSEVLAAGIISASGNSIVGLNFLVCGNFIIDVDKTFLWCDFKFQPGAGLDINTEGKCEFVQGSFTGCSTMWKGIDVYGSGIHGNMTSFLNVERFSDAEHGIIIHNYAVGSI